MKKRSGEAQAAQRRPPVVMKHRLTPRGGSQAAIVEDVCDHVSDPEDADYCKLCNAELLGEML